MKFFISCLIYLMKGIVLIEPEETGKYFIPEEIKTQ
jgi:hypothetical protein